MNPESSDQIRYESYQNDSSSKELSYLLQGSSTPLHHKKSNKKGMWVFWSKNENNSSSSSAHLHDKIKSVLDEFCTKFLSLGRFTAQLWAPVTIGGGRQLLSTSGRPFATSVLSMELATYRLNSEKYKYDIDDVISNVNIDIEEDIKIGGPATAFINRLPYSDESESFPGYICFMVPICFSSPQSDCVGVLEIIRSIYAGNFILDLLKEVKEAGLDVCNDVQQHILYKTLTPAMDEIKHALEIVCKSHFIYLAQVWIAVEDKRQVPLSEDTRRILGLKLASYRHYDDDDDDDRCYILDIYNCLSDVFALTIKEDHALKTLEDFTPRYISKSCNNLLDSWSLYDECCAFAICLRSLDTGDINFAFQFIWPKHPRCDIIFLEAILFTIRRCLPSFKFASGVELGDELDVIEVGCSEDGQNKYLKVFQGKQPTAVDNIAISEVTRKTSSTVLPLKDMEKQHSDVICAQRPMEKTLVKYKTAEINLTLEVIEKHYDKPMKEAAKILDVSESTLKRKLRKFGIPEWPKRAKRNKSDLSINQIGKNEEDNGATQKPSTMTIKAEYAGSMIKISHFNSQITFETIKKEIGMKFNLSIRDYNLKYLDEDGDWIRLISDEEMSDCINSSRKSDRIVIRIRVEPSTNIQS